MRNVEDGLIHDRLYVEAGAGEEELFVRVDVGVDAGVDGRLAAFEAEVGSGAEGIGHAHMASFMREDARSKSGRKVAPVVSGCSMIRRIGGSVIVRAVLCEGDSAWHEDERDKDERPTQMSGGRSHG